MSKVLVLFAHPVLEKSRVHARMIKNISKIPGITFRDLYEIYPEFDIDVPAEQEILLKHDVIVWQHPFYWYSAPSLIKQWMDLVLEHGWAYGSEGKMLEGKIVFNTLSCGGPLEAYSKEGRNRFSIPDFLAPFNQTAFLCKMIYLPPFVVPGTHRLKDAEIEKYAFHYENLLNAFANDQVPISDLGGMDYLNKFLPSINFQMV